MNIYIVVEGKSEKPIYKSWIPFVNNRMRYVENIYDIQHNNFAIISAQGNPRYYELIESAIEDVNDHGNIDRLVIAVDSEELSRQEKYDEVKNYISNKKCISQISIIIQHFCIETWALGNRRILSRNTQSYKLREYQGIFNVLDSDPELLPNLTSKNLNRAQFAYKYLKAILNEKFRNLTYRKGNPKPLLHPKYFEQVKRRFIDTGHIQSFNDFLNVF